MEDNKAIIQIPFLSMLIFVIFLTNMSSFSENAEAQFEVPEKTFPKSENSAKVNALIQSWQSSIKPELFAKENNMTYLDGKIVAYIYLQSPEYLSNLPLTIDVFHQQITL
jgi:hypothetical protein